ncbi:hypothetical protein QMK33_12840 [Hymenobacter sp. H14-R3]|uniref:type II toxin-antitoxin system Phd/YefM family antitoxin n=1 Tax=Hymenobacter sp. H14-R3 TaxID=3046308 RepID=UPI0024BACBE1|nr:hypothetical protein [Hymenobacter sp. H14-R3]MDJ0366043.1 hypothetical protein [Hymenobacter sp. H14-R3]
MQPDLGTMGEQVARTGKAAEIAWTGRATMALLPTADLSAMQETLHLFSSRANARALFDAMDRAERGEGTIFSSVEDLQQRLGLGDE